MSWLPLFLDIGFPSFFESIQISTTGVLLDSLQHVKKVIADHCSTQADQDYPLEKFSIVWSNVVKEGVTFSGVLTVLGEGEVYIFHAPQSLKVSIQDIVLYGQDVCSFHRLLWQLPT